MTKFFSIFQDYIRIYSWAQQTSQISMIQMRNCIKECYRHWLMTSSIWSWAWTLFTLKRCWTNHAPQIKNRKKSYVDDRPPFPTWNVKWVLSIEDDFDFCVNYRNFLQFTVIWCFEKANITRISPRWFHSLADSIGLTCTQTYTIYTYTTSIHPTLVWSKI